MWYDLEENLDRALSSITEDQLRGPTGSLRRKQSSFPQSFGPTRSFGGATGKNKKRKKNKTLLDRAFGGITAQLESVLNSGK